MPIRPGWMAVWLVGAAVFLLSSLALPDNWSPILSIPGAIMALGALLEAFG